jgi:hypothetical protein
MELSTLMHNANWLLPTLGTTCLIIWSIVQLHRGYVGGQDVTFLTLRVSRTLPRTLEANAVRSDKLRHIIDNPILRLVILWLFAHRDGYLQVTKSGVLVKQWQRNLQRWILNAFDDECSEIANQATGMKWATGVPCISTRFIFGVSSRKSTRGRRKIRVTCITSEALEWVREEGVDSIQMAERLTFMKPILEWMMRTPEALDTFDLRELLPESKAQAEERMPEEATAA